ncbi:MAG: aldehyde dehydrogenase family protein [Acidimicrobiia bacterium]
MDEQLEGLSEGAAVLYGGDKVTRVSRSLAERFRPGDRLVVVQSTGDLLHVPASVWDLAQSAVGRAAGAFAAMGTVADAEITAFYEAFASRLEDDAAFGAIASANADDVERARDRGRSTTRLVLSDTMRKDMIDGLRLWRDSSGGRGEVVETVHHVGWRVEQVRSGLGVVGFVFEGRPNVFADATGVIRSGNTVVFRIGSDALGTAEAIVEHALDPALASAGLPEGTASLVASPSRAAGWAMFSDERLALAVARGSGGAVSQLGAVARQTGIPVSLHGTGGAWIVAAHSADAADFAAAVYHSLDRKVCNTLTTCCIVESRAGDLVPVFLETLRRVEARSNASAKLHVVKGGEPLIPADWFAPASIGRAQGDVTEPQTELIAGDELGHEWEWEASPEVTLAVVPDVGTAVRLFNEQSPKFAASLISGDAAEHERFFDMIDSPFVGNGMTRWVDGQYALDRPELGLSNWQFGRLFGRGGVLSGDSAFTIRTRAVLDDPDLGR